MRRNNAISMSTKLHLALIANYRPDGQASMLRFADMLEEGLRARGQTVTRLEPGKILGGSGPAAKWRGYADKFLLAPGKLKRQLRALAASGDTVVAHICDHSNAPYLPLTLGLPTVITCHDVMAIKSGLGLVPQNPTRLTGRLLQNWILRRLKDAPHAACVSVKTRHDLQTLTGLPDERLTVIPNGLPYPFHPFPVDEPPALPGGIEPPYFLHVGSDAWYKNRTGAFALYRALLPSLPTAQMVFVGPHSPGLAGDIRMHHLGPRTRFLTGVSNEQLNALYARAECLLFPSWEEGFGWPIAEAQASGCPVAIPEREPMSEVGGDAAIRLPAAPLQPDRTDKWARQCAARIGEALSQRESFVAAGLANVRRFAPTHMIDHYLELYRHLVER
jgi:glycosyltransferase involved in cell wall biosynthesis